MTCSKCMGVMYLVEYGDFFEAHEAWHCLCGRIEWVQPVPYAKPDLEDYRCDLTQ